MASHIVLTFTLWGLPCITQTRKTVPVASLSHNFAGTKVGSLLLSALNSTQGLFQKSCDCFSCVSGIAMASRFPSVASSPFPFLMSSQGKTKWVRHGRKPPGLYFFLAFPLEWWCVWPQDPSDTHLWNEPSSAVVNKKLCGEIIIWDFISNLWLDRMKGAQ